MDVPARHGLRETMHTPLGQPRLLGRTAYALPTLLTKTLENRTFFSHNPMSVGSLKED